MACYRTKTPGGSAIVCGPRGRAPKSAAQPRGDDWVVIEAAVMGFNGNKSIKIKISRVEERWLGLSVIHPDDLPTLRRAMKWDPINFRIRRWLAEKMQLVG